VEQALELIQENNPASIDQALALLQNTVYSFSMKVCGHPEDAEDTMQEVLLKSIPHLAKFGNPQALTVWLYKVARNHCVSRRRGDKNSSTRNMSLDALMPDSRELGRLVSRTPSPETAVLNNETAEHVKQAILALPPQYRVVLVLHDMEDLSTSEVAQVLDIREGTVRVRLHRARLSVRQQLSRISIRPQYTGLEIQASAESTRPQRCRRLFASLSDYMDGIVDDAVCEEMDRHIHDCKPCQAFLTSLKQTVAQCRSYAPPGDAVRSEELRQGLLLKYQRAVATLAERQAAAAN
jgi:RNA polymerase sigma-70 factor (ECF subfamily)